MLTQFLKKITSLKAGKELPKRDFLKRISSFKLPGMGEFIQTIKWRFNKRDDDVWLVH